MWAQALQSSTPWVFGISGNQQAHLLLSLMYPTARNVEKLAEMEHKLQGCWLLNSIPANHITGLITQKQLCQSHNAWRQKAPQSKQGFLIKLYHSVKQLRSGATGKWFVFLFFFFWTSTMTELILKPVLWPRQSELFELYFHCCLKWHRALALQKLQIYQHMCPAVFRWLQGFNELTEKIFIENKSSESNRYHQNNDYYCTDECRLLCALSHYSHIMYITFIVYLQ